MKRSLARTANILALGRKRAWVSLVAWLDLERSVSKVFDKLSESSSAAELGGIYLTKNADYPPFDKRRFSPLTITNQIQISVGLRGLGVSHAVVEGERAEAEMLIESGATLWYSQNASGSVAVFLAPYTSKAMSVDEKKYHYCSVSLCK